MRPEDLRLTFASFRVMYPPLEKFEGSELIDFCARIHDAHPFEDYHQFGSEGATMAIEAQRWLEIERGEMSHDETVTTDFEIVKRNAEDLVDAFMDDFEPYAMRGPMVKLRALWECTEWAEAGEFTQFFRDNVLTLDEDQYGLLDSEDPVGPSVKFHGAAEDPHRHWRFEIAPYWVDEMQVSIDLDVDFVPGNIVEPKNVSERMQLAYTFLLQNVVPFVNSFLP